MSTRCDAEPLPTFGPLGFTWDRQDNGDLILSFPSGDRREATGAEIAFATQYGRLRAENRRLRDALEFVKSDLEECDWHCCRCGADYGMKDTDIYLMVTRAINGE